MRALLTKQSATNGIFFRVPLKYFGNPFFGIDFCYPGKRVWSVSLRQSPDERVIIKPDGDNNTYSVKIDSIVLKLSYVTLDPSIRSRWYESLERSKLIRSFRYYKSSHFTLGTQLSTFFLPNVMSYSRFPISLKIVILPENLFNGRWRNSYDFSYGKNIKSISVFKNGVQIPATLCMDNMDLSHSDSADALHLYNEFRRLCCHGKINVTYEEFFTGLFVFAIDLTLVPNELTNFDNYAQLTTVGSIDVEIGLRSVFESSMVMELIAEHDAVCHFDSTGDLISCE